MVAAVLLALALGMCGATLPGAPALAATSCANDPSLVSVATTTAGVTRTEAGYAHRVAGKCRTLVTQLRTPTGSSSTPRPVILALHGRDGSPDSLAPLLDAWATAGYVVVAPKLPETKKDERGRALRSEVLLQAADARFVLDQVLDRAADLDIDPDEVGAAGMSLGGLTVYALVSHTCCKDGRIKAAVVMSGVHDPLPSGRYDHQDVPVLLLHGDADRGYRHSTSAYAQLAPPKWFITLHGEGHSPPFEVPRSPVSELVDVTTTSFWDRSLKHDVSAAPKIVAAVKATDGSATLRQNLSSK